MTDAPPAGGEPVGSEDPEGSPRARRMAERILRTAVDRGVPAVGLSLLGRAHRTAMRFREGGEEGIPGLPSDQHPAFLHPGRTVLILLDDVQETDARVLAVAAMTDRRDTQLQVRAPVALRVLGGEDEAYEWWEAVPAPDWRRGRDPAAGSGADADAVLLEGLIALPQPVRTVALAEALDHLRHAHLWASFGERRRAVELARNVFGPVAPRVHPILDRRLRWWLERVAPGLEGAVEGGGVKGEQSSGEEER